MNENNTIPYIEREISEPLSGEMRETTRNLTKYSTANHLTPKLWFFAGDYGNPLDADTTKAVRDGVRPLVSCTNDCPQGTSMTIFGQEHANVCFQFPIQFENPGHDTLEHIKELIEYWKGAASCSDSRHSH